jgi:tetratricopeptide (TPR) repeat protein
MALARAHGLFAQRFNDAQHKVKAIELLHDLSDRPNLRPAQLLSIGVDLETLGDTQTAEQIYQKISPSDDSAGIARNNLAMILARRGEFAEAMQLAKSAVQASSGRSYALDTLAFVQRQSKDYNDAVVLLRRIVQLEPWAIPSRLTLAEVLLEAGLVKDAVTQVSTIDEIVSDEQALPKPIKERIEALRQNLKDRSTARSGVSSSGDLAAQISAQ